MHLAVLADDPKEMREVAAVTSNLYLILESCFMNPAIGHRHEYCREKAVGLLGLERDVDNEAIWDAAQDSRDFHTKFYCLGEAVTCANCGSLVPPGWKSCPQCDEEVTQLASLLAKPQWQQRMTIKALEVAIATDEVSSKFLMYSINNTVRLYVASNFLGHSSNDPWTLQVKHIRDAVVDIWPEDKRPDSQTWEYRYIRACAVFWLLAWPMLEKYFNFRESMEFSSPFIRSIAASAQRWVEADADPDEYGRLVREAMDNTKVNALEMIRAIAPASQDEGESGKTRVVFRPEEVLRRGNLAYVNGDAWLVIPLEPEEASIMISHYRIVEESPQSIIERITGS